MGKGNWWITVAALAGAGCLTTGGGFGDGNGDDDISGDGDADTDADTDADADADSDSDTGPGDECPAYPDDANGWRQGEILSNFSMPGNDPDDETWTAEDFWCQAHRAENPATVLVINVHSLT